MDCDICFLCHSHIDFAKLTEAYPHLCESDRLPLQGLSHLEEKIYWGTICVECAQKAETPPPEALPFRSVPAARRQTEPRIIFSRGSS